MNETALVIGCVVALGYYFYSKHKGKSIAKSSVESEVKEHKASKK
jgi:hypothetical protein